MKHVSSKERVQDELIAAIGIGLDSRLGLRVIKTTITENLSTGCLYFRVVTKERGSQDVIVEPEPGGSFRSMCESAIDLLVDAFDLGKKRRNLRFKKPPLWQRVKEKE